MNYRDKVTSLSSNEVHAFIIKLCATNNELTYRFNYDTYIPTVIIDIMVSFPGFPGKSIILFITLTYYLKLRIIQCFPGGAQ